MVSEIEFYDKIIMIIIIIIMVRIIKIINKMENFQQQKKQNEWMYPTQMNEWMDKNLNRLMLRCFLCHRDFYSRFDYDYYVQWMMKSIQQG